MEACGDVHAAAVRVAALLPAWANVPVEVAPLNSLSRYAFKLTSPQKPGDALCVRLLRPQVDSSLVCTMQALADVGLGLPVLAADSAVVVQPYPARGTLDPAACKEPVQAGRIGRFVAALHRLPASGAVVPKARPDDLKNFMRELVEVHRILPLGAATELAMELDVLAATLPARSSGAADQRLVWTHGTLGLESMFEIYGYDEVSVYEGHLSHPAIGQNVEMRVELETATRGRWYALGKTVDVVVERKDDTPGSIIFRDTTGATRLEGLTQALGAVRGDVVQGNVRGGSFVFLGMSETRVDPGLKTTLLEMPGTRPAVTDLSYLFLMWCLLDGAQYPPLQARQAFLLAYLVASDLPHDVSSITDLLWAVECEAPFQAVWLGLAATLASATRSSAPSWAAFAQQLLTGLPRARLALVNSLSSVVIRQAVIEHGAFGVGAHHQ